MGDARPVVLLTGASGVVGRALLRELVGWPVICLAHTTDVGVDGVRVVRADLSRPRMGLEPDAWAALAREVDVVVHSGGLTEWGQPYERYQAINVDGTRHVLEFAAAAGGVPVHHMSTSFVAALLPGAPDFTLRPQNVVAPYVRSKREAELLLAGSGLPHVVYRPTNLIGDSRTGETVRGQIVQLMSDWICRGRATLFPAHPGNLVDIVPQDLLSRAVVQAILDGDTAGEWWVTYGPEAMDVADAIEVCVRHAAKHGRTVRPPRIVHPDDLDPAELDALAPMSRAYTEVLIDVSEITAASGAVLPTSMPELRDRFGVPKVVDTEAYQRSLDYWAAHGG
jgi:nucleoside-diphosphate-sugar epimerase